MASAGQPRRTAHSDTALEPVGVPREDVEPTEAREHLDLLFGYGGERLPNRFSSVTPETGGEFL